MQISILRVTWCCVCLSSYDEHERNWLFTYLLGGHSNDFLIQVSLHSLNCINFLWVIFRVLFTLWVRLLNFCMWVCWVLAEIDKAVVLPSPNDLNWWRSFGLIYYLVQVWDKRCFITKGQAAGVLMGHLEGITFIDSRGDGRYLISNGKDQTIKLWDIRKMSSNAM